MDKEYAGMKKKKLEKTDAEKIKYFDELGETKLPQKFRQQILTIFQKYPDKWFTPEMFGEGLDMSEAYARKVCEALVLARLVTRQGSDLGMRKKLYYRFKTDPNERSEEKV